MVKTKDRKILELFLVFLQLNSLRFEADFNFLGFFEESCSAAVGARLFDDRPLAVAGRACLRNREKSAAASELTASFAGGAHLSRTSLFRSCSVAEMAGRRTVEGDIFGNTRIGFFERNHYLRN